MNSHTTARFRECLASLPAHVREHAGAAYRRFLQNPRHPGLQFKRVHSRDQVYSARVSIDYRAIGVMQGDAIIWFWIGSHAEYERIIRSL